MKNCPFCGAVLADEAKFCLYCMKPLAEKETIPPLKRRPKGWLFVLGGIALLAVAILLLWHCAGDVSGDPALPVTTLPSSSVTTAPTASTNPVTTLPTTVPSTVTTRPTSAPTTASTTLPTVSNKVQYLYRSAQAGDDFYAYYQNPGDHIVITGIKSPASGGIYDIPSMIDGKTVVAIMSNAFSGSNAKAVYIPATVKTVHDYAFNGCALTDVYFRGNAIYCYPNAFPKNFTLHCSADCHNRNLQYYKSAAVNYSATWEEWNGEV